MKIEIGTRQFRAIPGKQHLLSDHPTNIKSLYTNKDEYKNLLDEYQDEIFDLQNMLFAHDRYALLLIFQGMDTSGKDGAIRQVMSGIDPAGVQVFSFKKPSATEMDHDYLWRTNLCLPERGRIGIFNRSYYEEVLIVKVHPEILSASRIPNEMMKNDDSFWQSRYSDIRNHEAYLYRNGIRVVKFFMHLSKEEQRQRFLSRIQEPAKNWKFSVVDVNERGYWDEYQKAYEACIRHTTTEESPWYVIPADEKKNARLIIAKVVLETMRSLHISYPELPDGQKKELEEIRGKLEGE